MSKGLFITFEGGEGSGKTTVCKYIYHRLLEEGIDAIYSREPGGVDIAEQIRNVILSVKNTAMDVRTEALLYAASRRQHLVEVILPALQAGKVVICDRFIDSSLAYQGHARDIGIDEVMEINRFAIDNCMPDLTLFFDVDVETGLRRITGRGEKLDRLDRENLAFHHKVHEGYMMVCERYPERIKIIDASQSVDKVEKDAYELVIERIKKNV
ncbi:MAG: dTMP kinase [Erysipelotrichaceae bacterium]|nr:dTMP kinase [Erysipelotrichaceae bacterium]MBR2599901.1 dTMP kinase [Erysipelotrichaceae bacterium]MBR2791408.1 dTMP kinase [Erysipelotrichaceae bacterium]MBR6957149.1 dTMP kinase [Erysipelotrichaceae bacterium]